MLPPGRLLLVRLLLSAAFGARATYTRKKSIAGRLSAWPWAGESRPRARLAIRRSRRYRPRGHDDRPSQSSDLVADRGHPADRGARGAAQPGLRPHCLRGVQRRRGHRLFRRPDRAGAASNLRHRPDAGPDRGQAARRRHPDDARGDGPAHRAWALSGGCHPAARDPGQRASRISRRHPHRLARDAARQVENRISDGRARDLAGREFLGGHAPP